MIEIRQFGSLELTNGERTLSGDKTSPTFCLLAYLLAVGGSSVPESELAFLWENRTRALSPASLVSRLQTHLTALGGGEKMPLVCRDRGMLRLCPDGVLLRDVNRFDVYVRLLRGATPTLPEEIDARADTFALLIKLYRGPYLADFSHLPPVAEKAETYRRVMAELCEKTMALLYAAGRFERIETLAPGVLTADGLSAESLYYWKILALLARGQKERAATLYAAAITLFLQRLHLPLPLRLTRLAPSLNRPSEACLAGR